MDIPIVGFPRPVSVVIVEEDQQVPAGILPPDTRYVESFVGLDRGENIHGSLREDVFVCDDNDYDHGWTVLWVTLNASQQQDDVQRLAPACLLPADWCPDDLAEETESLIEDFGPLELEGLILWWAYARHRTSSWGAQHFADDKVHARLMPSELAGAVFQAGVSGEPLNLSEIRRLLRKDDGSSAGQFGLPIMDLEKPEKKAERQERLKQGYLEAARKVVEERLAKRTGGTRAQEDKKSRKK